MEHIGDILKRTTTRTSTSKGNTDTSSADEITETTLESSCPLCNGSGYVHPLLPTGKPDFSRVVVCRCAKTKVSKERQDRLQRYSNLGSLTSLTFDTLSPDGRSGNPDIQQRCREAYQAARQFATTPKGWLIFVGPPGSGKTHVAAAIVNERISHGLPAFFVTTPDLLDHLRSAFNPNSEMPYDELFERVKNSPLLVLDDFGAQASTPWAKEKLDQLLNHRFNNELPTVITTAIPVDELDESIRARFTDPQRCRILVTEDKRSLSNNYDWPPEFKLQKSMTFENFDSRRMNLPAEQRENLAEAYRLAFDFAKEPEGWLVFMGVTGCGKTHLASAIVNYRYQAKQPALFIVVPEFLDHLRSTFAPESKVSYDQVFERVKKAPLLVLDDFGEQSTTPWAQEKLYQVINYRYNARLATVITTRYSLDEIMERVESTISSRLSDPKISQLWNITVPDYRTTVTPSAKRTPRRNSRSAGRWD
jgi:DNA replication protein DnaC